MSISNSATNQRISKVTVTSAQILDLVANPVTLIPAPGAGNLIIFDIIVMTMDFNSIAYNGSGTIFSYGLAINNLTNSPDIRIVGKTFDVVATFFCNTLPRGTNDPASVYINQPVIWQNLATNLTDGDSDIKFSISYNIIQTGL